MTTINRTHQSGLRSGAYARLGLRPCASPIEIKVAYRRLAKRFHPDRAGDEGLAAFLSIQAAYEALLNRAPSATPIVRHRPTASTPMARPVRRAHPNPTRTYVARPPERQPAWEGARWYWEGVRANASKRSTATGRTTSRNHTSQ
jgi:curved DNA-binding protein CbpA